MMQHNNNDLASHCLILKLKLVNRLLTSVDVKHHDAIARLKSVPIVFNTRMRSVAGTAETRRCPFTKAIQSQRITLNANLFKTISNDLDTTLAHELAHLAANILYYKLEKGHGRYWRNIMQVLGYNDERCHSIPGAYKMTHKPVAEGTCGCPGYKHTFKPRSYNKVRQGATYRCRKCKQNITITYSDY
jgi:predicted SprT family Zn-dependent metalloprotease